MSQKNDIELQTPLPIEECLVQLRAATSEESWSEFLSHGMHPGSRSIVGKFSGKGFRLQKRRRAWVFRNDFAPTFWGTLSAESKGTKISGSFGPTPFGLIMKGITLAFSGVAGLPIFVLALLDLLTGTHYLSGDTTAGLVFFPVLLFAGVVFPRLSYWFAFEDEAFILQFLERTLQAKVSRAMQG